MFGAKKKEREEGERQEEREEEVLLGLHSPSRGGLVAG